MQLRKYVPMVYKRGINKYSRKVFTDRQCVKLGSRFTIIQIARLD